MVYLFIGEDQFSKNIKLDKLKKDLFTKGLQAFNFDLLFARDLNLVKLQEVLFRLPYKARKRLVLIREAASLKEPLKKYLSAYIKKSNPNTLLILDIERFEKRDTFLKTIEKSVTSFHFKTPEVQDTFKLSQQIDKKRIPASLKILSKLLSSGVRPEKIMGGLRYCWENNYLDLKTKERRLNLLLDCDISIKRGRLKPQIALERLLIEICRL